MVLLGTFQIPFCCGSQVSVAIILLPETDIVLFELFQPGDLYLPARFLAEPELFPPKFLDERCILFPGPARKPVFTARFSKIIHSLKTNCFQTKDALLKVCGDMKRHCPVLKCIAFKISINLLFMFKGSNSFYAY